MAQIPNLQSTNTLGEDDQAILRQGAIDKRIGLNLAGILSWAKRNGYTHIGEHTTGSQFPDTKSFTTYQGQVYFVKSGVSLPYNATSSDPSTDNNLKILTESTYPSVLKFSNLNEMILQGEVDNVYRVDDYVWLRESDTNNTLEDFKLLSVSGTVPVGIYDKVNTTLSTSDTVEWYVDPVNGVDSLGRGLQVGNPVRTIQFAIDSMPQHLSATHPQKVILVAGTHSESSRQSSEMARPAVVYPNDKIISNRSTQVSGGITGALIIEGQGVGNTFIQTNPAEGITYGVYASGVEVVLSNLSVIADESAGAAGSSSLVVSHRGAYVHGKGVHIGSSNAQLGLVCEAGGWAEFISSSIKDCGGTDVVVYQDSSASLAGSGSDIGHITNNGFLQIAESCVVNGDQLHTAGSQCQVTSYQASTKCTINGNISGRGSQLSAAFADFNGVLSCEMSGVRLSTCAYQDQLSFFGGELLLAGTDSFTGVNTENNSLTPVVLRDGANFKKDLASNIVNSNGDAIGADYGNLRVSVNANDFTIPVSVTGKEIDIEVIGGGSNRTGATLPATSSVGQYADGTVLRLTGAGNNVEIVESTTSDIPSGAITVGGLVGGYSGATFVYSARASRWRLQSVGLQN